MEPRSRGLNPFSAFVPPGGKKVERGKCTPRGKCTLVDPNWAIFHFLSTRRNKCGKVFQSPRPAFHFLSVRWHSGGIPTTFGVRRAEPKRRLHATRFAGACRRFERGKCGCGHTKLQQAVLSTPTRTEVFLVSFRTILVRCSTSNPPGAVQGIGPDTDRGGEGVAPGGEAIDRSADVGRVAHPLSKRTSDRFGVVLACAGGSGRSKGCAWVGGEEDAHYERWSRRERARCWPSL